MRIQCICLRCGAAFDVWPSRLGQGRGKFCSRTCTYPMPIQRTCLCCGLAFTIPPSGTLRNHGRYCSKPCAYKSQHPDPETRFWANVQRGASDECWPWIGKTRRRSPGGGLEYGAMKWRGTFRGAHAIAWELANGRSIPDGKQVNHTCDVSLCCNPQHVYPGTTVENVADMIARDRNVKGERVNTAKLTAAQVAEIRMRYTDTRGAKAALAREYGISQSSLGCIINRQNWRHVE